MGGNSLMVITAFALATGMTSNHLECESITTRETFFPQMDLRSQYVTWSMVDLAIPTGVKELWLEISDSLGTLGKHAPRHSCGYAYLHPRLSRSKNKPPTILINNAKNSWKRNRKWAIYGIKEMNM